MGLFETAGPVATRLKMYVYGNTGTGKTITSLHFPNPAVVDAERGTEYYGKLFNFERIFTSDPNTIIAAIDELLQNPVINGKPIKTFVIDPISVVNDAIIAGHESRMKIKSGNPNYQLKPLDYKFIKSEIKRLGLKLLSLDMNVIVTAKEKLLYSSEEFMKVEGTTPEGPKEFPYLFDVVLKLSKTKDGKFWATVEKDRTNSLPAEFEYSYPTFVKYLGMEGLEREPVVFNQQKTLNARANRTYKVSFNGADMFTAGISADNLGQIQSLIGRFGKDEFAVKLKEEYLVDSVLDLKNDEAELLIRDINTLLNESSSIEG